MGTGVSISDELFRPGIQVLLGVSDALAESQWNRSIQDTDTVAFAGGDFDSIEAWSRLRTARTDSPHLSRRQRIGVDRFVAVQLWRSHELLDSVLAHRVAEVRVPEFALEYPFLLLLDPAAGFESDTNQYLQFIRPGLPSRGLDTAA